MRAPVERLAEGSYRTDSAEGTVALGAALGEVLAEGDVVVLEGELGAGKTQLVKGVASALGVEGEVTSPTFNLLVSHGGGRLELHHMDLYRLESVEELGEAGALDVVGADGACLIEWGGPFIDALGLPRLEVAIVRVDEEGAEVDGGGDGAASGEGAAGAEGAVGGVGAADTEPARLIHLRGVGRRGLALAEALDRALR